MVKWDAELAKFASASAATVDSIGSGGNFISFKGGKITYKGGEIPGNKMEVVVLEHVLERNWFAGRYDPANPAPPSCYAFGREKDGMAPDENSSDIQNDVCETCPHNEWGSADTGRGKACKEIVRLALLSRSDLDEDIEAAEVAYAKIPVTSTKGWAGYVRQVKDVLNRPPFAVVTEVSVVPDSENQFKILFKLIEPIEDGDVIGALVAKHKDEATKIIFPYPKIEAKPAKAAPKPKGKRKF
jgi:hypothetical protein